MIHKTALYIMERLKTNLKTDNKPRKYSYNSNGELPMHINLFLQKNKSSELKKPKKLFTTKVYKDEIQIPSLYNGYKVFKENILEPNNQSDKLSLSKKSKSASVKKLFKLKVFTDEKDEFENNNNNYNTNYYNNYNNNNNNDFKESAENYDIKTNIFDRIKEESEVKSDIVFTDFYNKDNDLCPFDNSNPLYNAIFNSKDNENNEDNEDNEDNDNSSKNEDEYDIKNIIINPIRNRSEDVDLEALDLELIGKKLTYEIRSENELSKINISEEVAVKNKTSTLESYVSSVYKKNEKIMKDHKNDINIKNLTNTEDIVDFYDYLHECLIKIKKIVPVSEKELDKNKINYELDKTKYETLIHCKKSDLSNSDIVLKVKLENGEVVEVGINIRPFIYESLKLIKEYNYDIICYTASVREYANVVLDYIERDNKIFSKRLYRNNCIRVKIESDYAYVKDLKIFHKINLNDIIIIDNSCLSFAFHLDNGIPILPFYDNKNDKELLILANYLKELSNTHDIRVTNRKIMKYYHEYSSSSENEQRVNNKNESDKEIIKTDFSNISDNSLDCSSMTFDNNKDCVTAIKKNYDDYKSLYKI